MPFKMKGFKAHDMKKKSPLNKKGPCWTGYEMVGMKKKGVEQYLTAYLKNSYGI